MACITLFAQPMTMATTQLARVIHNEDVLTCPWEGTVDRSSVRMSWVVVTDGNDDRKLQIQWAPSEKLV
ncbi:MAG TPA: hypothetical protein VFL34_16295 [Candidatus Sulfotelmatobacter sp.]|nr:hypothetical protein [Candidatus Sulfotelmatobacter sp.]